MFEALWDLFEHYNNWSEKEHSFQQLKSTGVKAFVKGSQPYENPNRGSRVLRNEDGSIRTCQLHFHQDAYVAAEPFGFPPVVVKSLEALRAMLEVAESGRVEFAVIYCQAHVQPNLFWDLSKHFKRLGISIRMDARGSGLRSHYM